MWQRIQTIFLILAFIATVICLCSPLGYFEPAGMGGNTVMYNLWNVMPDGARNFGGVWPLFVLLLITCPLNLWAIISYKNRKRQVRLCTICVFLIFLWICYGIGLIHGQNLGFESKFHPNWLIDLLPVLAFVFYMLARRGIIKDEKLVRSMDHIR